MKNETLDFSALIRERRLVSNGILVKNQSLKEFESYRILDKPFNYLLVDELKKTSWTITELVDRFGVDPLNVREAILWTMNEISLFEEGYIFRRIQKEKNPGKGSLFRYTLIPIPFETRVFDPFLWFSLLDWTSFLEKYDDQIMYSEKDECLHEYRKIVSECWNIPVSKVDQYLEKENLKFINSLIGPLPVLDDIEIYTNTNNKLKEDKSVLSPLRFNDKKINHDLHKINSFIRGGFGTIGDFVFYSVRLYDDIHFCQSFHKHKEMSQFFQLNETFFKTFLRIE
ncbi:hypothetical protein ACSAZK_17470 [Methanosarcina sp. Mfa9]|uniref:hypothetical protein n=1 Tax=Methanosarcina sp. Mfa9 TaxID=3439063 RepID=UPI003F87C11E